MIRGKIMMNNNLDINLNSKVSLPYELDKIHPQDVTAGRRGDDGDEGAGEDSDDDDDPDEVQLDDDDDDFPLREGISPADFCCRRAFSLCVFSAPQRWQSLSAILPPVLGFRGDDIREGAMPEVDQGDHTTWRRGLGLAHARDDVGPWWLTSPSPSGYFRLLAEYELLGIF
jgi:hypothetical protein